MRLDVAITNYLAYRKSLGDRFHTNEGILKSFCRAIGGETEVTDIRAEQVSAFLNGAGPITASWHIKHDALLGFYRYALSRGLATISPLPVVKPQCPRTFAPYIYSHEELRRLLGAALTYQKHRGHLEPFGADLAAVALRGGTACRRSARAAAGGR